MAVSNTIGGGGGDSVSAQLRLLQRQVQALQSKVFELEAREGEDNIAVGAAQLVGPVKFGAEGAISESDVAVAVLQGHTSGAIGYDADIYFDDGTSAIGTVFLTEVGPHQTLPSGTRVLVHPRSTASVEIRSMQDDSYEEESE